MEEFIIKKPVKKMDVYVADFLTTTTMKSVRIKIPNATFLAIHEIKNGHLIKLFSESEVVKDLDSYVLNEVIKNNQNWFHNDLTDKQIKQYHRESYNRVTKTIDILVSDVRIPKIYRDDKPIESLKETIKVKDTVEIEIECQGIYFYNKKFGIRWFLKHLNINSEDQYNDEFIDKEVINEEWNEMIQKLFDSIEEDCEEYENSKKKLIEFKQKIEEEFHNVKSQKDEYEWNRLYFNLSKKLDEYYSNKRLTSKLNNNFII